ncbi:MAG: cytochrome c biogenesis protein CcsA [Microthrixaceae bacterium]|nr:cytochrome c biogenesis protein CcsA [Microthrixaceae bacterium]
MTDLAVEPDPAGRGVTSTASRGTRILGAATIVSMAVLLLYAFGITSPDAQLGESIRIMYVHVPTISLTYLLMVLNAACGVFYLRRRSEFADLLGHAAGELAVLFLGFSIVSGALWGRITWGAYWVWDARLTTTAVLFLLYVGYLAVRAVQAEPQVRGTRSAIVGIAAALLIPIVHKSVDWWSSLHQQRTLFGTLDPEIGGTQLFTLLFSFVAFGFLAAWLLVHRFRVAWLAERMAERELEFAIAERRSEAQS